MRSILHLALFLAVASAPATAQIQTDERPKITVTGEAVVQVVPDRVDLQFGIETHDFDMRTAKERNSAILDRAVAALKELGIEEKNIRTDHLTIEPRYKSGYQKENFLGYFVRNAFSVSTDEPDQVEELITQVLEAGVTHIHGVQFRSSEFKKHRSEARKLALEAAQEKAREMAATLGRAAGAALQIQELGQYGGWHYWGGWGYGMAQGMSQNVIQNVSGPGAQVGETVALGKISIRGSVSVSFELR